MMLYLPEFLALPWKFRSVFAGWIETPLIAPDVLAVVKGVPPFEVPVFAIGDWGLGGFHTGHGSDRQTLKSETIPQWLDLGSDLIPWIPGLPSLNSVAVVRYTTADHFYYAVTGGRNRPSSQSWDSSEGHPENSEFVDHFLIHHIRSKTVLS